MSHTRHSASADAADARQALLDRLVGDPSAVDDYYTARHQPPVVDRDLPAGTPVPWTA